MRRKLLSLLLAVTLAVSMFNAAALAASAEDLPDEETKAACEVCGHEHDDECGYTAPTEGAPCTHVHGEECEFSGGGVEETPCNHQHDEACGYIAATEGTPCQHECEPEVKMAEVKKTSAAAFQVVDGQSYTTLNDAIDEIESRDDKTGTITLSADADFSETVMIDPGADITITSADAGNPVTLKRTDENGNMDFSNATLRLKNITLDGGAVWGSGDSWYESNTGIKGTKSLLRAEDNPGAPAALYLNDATIQNCHYYEQSDEAYGAAICIISQGATVEINHSTIQYNVCATKDAGGSTKAARGAGIYLQDDSTTHAMTASITDTTLTQNAVLPESTARNNNGANAFFMGAAVKIDNCTFSHGFADEGAGMYVFYGAQIQLSNTNVEYNKGHQGVGIKIDTTSSASSIVKMASGSVRNNISIPYVSGATGGSGVGLEGGSGGVGLNYQSIFEMTGGTIESNSGATYGGGIYNEDSKTIVAGNAIIRGNQAAGGGGIMNYHLGMWGAAELSVLGKASITNNLAGDGTSFGNAIYVLDPNFYLDGQQTTIQGDIFLCSYANSTVKLVGVAKDNHFLLSTALDDSADNRVVVEPGTFAYAGNTYQVTDAEPEIAGFIHNRKRIVTGSSYFVAHSDAADHTGDLVLGADSAYMVTFDSQGGSYVPPVGNLSIGDKIKEPVPPVRDGFEFDGWFTQADAGDSWNFEEDTVPGNMTLYAHWTERPATYTVTYDANGGTGSAPAEPAEYTENATVTVLSNTFTNTGKNFTGWKNDEGNSYAVNSTFEMPAKDVTLYAQWEDDNSDITNYYNLTFETNGGSAVSPQKVKEKTTVQLTQVPSREGYTFEGWYADKNLTKKITSVYMDSDKTVYAKWTKNADKPPVNPGNPDKPGNVDKPGNSDKPGNQDKPGNSSKPGNPNQPPQTGDSSMVGLWMIVCVLSGAGLICILKKKRRQ